jgi:hypothetical protein
MIIDIPNSVIEQFNIESKENGEPTIVDEEDLELLVCDLLERYFYEKEMEEDAQ